MEGFEFQFVDATFLIALGLVGYKIYGTSKKMFGNTTAIRVMENDAMAEDLETESISEPTVAAEEEDAKQ